MKPELKAPWTNARQIKKGEVKHLKTSPAVRKAHKESRWSQREIPTRLKVNDKSKQSPSNRLGSTLMPVYFVSVGFVLPPGRRVQGLGVGSEMLTVTKREIKTLKNSFSS